MKVTVPVRGIRLHQVNNIKAEAMQIVTVPVRGIRLHLTSATHLMSLLSYCPREGYKVASLQFATSIRREPARERYCPREGYKVASWDSSIYGLRDVQLLSP